MHHVRQRHCELDMGTGVSDNAMLSSQRLQLQLSAWSIFETALALWKIIPTPFQSYTFVGAINNTLPALATGVEQYDPR